jgi:uncharacterized membrane protein YqjE
MEEFKKVEHLVEHVKEYINTRISLAKLEIAEKVSRFIAWIIAAVLVFFILLFFVVFLSLSAAHAIGDAFGKPYLGFLIVGGFYLLVAFFVWMLKEKLLRIPLMNAIVRQLFPEEKHSTNEED